MSWLTRLLGIPEKAIRPPQQWTAGGTVRVETPDTPVEQRQITQVPWNVGAPTSSSKVPTVDKALQLWAVYAAVRLLATNVAMLPLKAYRDLGDRRIAISLPSLFTQPSLQGTLWDWLHRLMTSLLLTGNAYGLITERDGYGFPTMVEWLHPEDLTVIDALPSGSGSFIRPEWFWKGRPVMQDELVHIPWFTVPGRVKGLSPLGAYASTVSSGLAASQYSKDWFDGGGVPPGTFKNVAKTLTQNEADEIKQRLVSAIQKHQPIVYGADWDYNPIGIPLKDMEFVEANQLTATQIAAVYGIEPAERIGGATGQPLTYTSSEAAQINFGQATLLPYLTKLEAAFFKLLPERQYVKFNLDAAIRTDLKTRHDVYYLDRQMGLKSVDELRELEDMQPLPQGEGEDYTPLGVLVKEGMTTVPQAKPVVVPLPNMQQSE